MPASKLFVGWLKDYIDRAGKLGFPLGRMAAHREKLPDGSFQIK
jgi:hypothetical protein